MPLVNVTGLFNANSLPTFLGDCTKTNAVAPQFNSHRQLQERKTKAFENVKEREREREGEEKQHIKEYPKAPLPPTFVSLFGKQ